VPVPACVWLTNIAVADVAADSVTVQAPEPAQEPDQPLKLKPLAGVAVRVTAVFALNIALQVLVQLIPAGDDVTVPDPAIARSSAYVDADTTLKLAETERAAAMVTEQAPVPVQAPDQPAKVDPEVGVAVSVTTELAANEAEQVFPQEMPAGEEETDPEPEPERVTPRA
jgi:hypothetical protein